ncbi:MAG: hypothetical protein K2Q10_12895, partial [Rhodospirillales bacterium]|nr:hypothetical protein [Rhodospirillales bacterium]
RWMFLLFVAAAVVLTWALVLDGRYRDVPVIAFLIPVFGTLGVAKLRLLNAPADEAFAFSALFGDGERPLPWLSDRMVSWVLGISAMANVVGEGFAIIGEDFRVMHPTFAEQWPLITTAMVANQEILVWSAMLLLLALPFVVSRRYERFRTTRQYA